MTDAVCKDCGAPLIERRKSARPGELLLICTGPEAHKWQARKHDGYLHLYRSNWKGHVGENRKIATITISDSERKIMEKNNVKQQEVFRMGIDTLYRKK